MKISQVRVVTVLCLVAAIGFELTQGQMMTPTQSMLTPNSQALPQQQLPQQQQQQQQGGAALQQTIYEFLRTSGQTTKVSFD